MSAPWSDLPTNDADVTVRAAPSLGLAHELFTWVSQMGTATTRIVEIQEEVLGNLAEFRARDDHAAVELIERALAALDLSLPVTTILPEAPSRAELGD